MRRTELAGSREGLTLGSGVRRVGLLALALFVAACSGDGSTTVDRNVLPIGGVLANHDSPGDPGQCFGDDAVEFFTNVDGLNANSDPEDVNCTANDIDIAIAIVGGVEGIPGYVTGDPVSCTPGGNITLNMSAQLVQNANSNREDIGVWIGTGQSSAITGQCNHYFLDTDLANTFNDDADHCAGMAVGASANLPLGNITVPCTAVTTDPPGDLQGPGTYLQVGACVSWKVPGADTECPDDRSGDGGGANLNSPDDFRAGTLLANKSKCNCEPFFIPLIVPGSITIVKNTEGGNGTFAFTHNVGTNSNPTVTSPFNITTVANTGMQQFGTVLPGTYTVTESGPPAGWQFKSLTCSAGGSVASQTATIVITPGANVTCTFTNTKLATITIIKNTVGGNATFAFTHTVGTASDPDVTSPFNITTVANTGQQVFSNVVPGTYTVTESAPPAGWQFTSLSCSAGGSGAGQVATINLAPGASVTCTYTNTKQGTITIIKNTVGGNATFAFTHTVGTLSDPDVTSPFNITTVGGTGQQQFQNVSPGTYTVTESAPPAGWSFVSLSCSAGGSNAGQVATIILPAGGSVTCTYTNANSGTITIVKNTVGGNGTFSFTHNVGTLSNPDVPSPFDITTVSNTGQQQFLQVPAGTYTVTESGPPAGWQFTSLSCSAGGSNAGQVATIILPAGGSVTCTYTNTKQGTITIIKNTVGGNGTFAFTHNVGTASDPDVTSPFNITTVANTGQQQFLNVSPGTYTVTESGPPAGWTFSSLSCSAGGSNAGQVATIILPAGGSVTCTFTNNAQGTITIIKNTVGANGTFAFTHNVGTNSNPTVTSPFNITTAGNTGQQQFLQVNTGTYTVTESGPPAGWQFTSLSCSAGGSGAGQVATIIMTPGASITCTFTNTKLGTITIIKNTVGGNGTFAFTHNVGTASDPDVTSPFNITTAGGTGQQQFLNVSPGSYTVTESAPPAGWDFTSLSCSTGGSGAGQVATINLPAGGSVTCTYTNTKRGSITIKKIVIGTGSTFEYTATSNPNTTPITTPFSIVVGDNSFNTAVFSNRVPGTYTVVEGPEADYTLTDVSCSTAAGVGVVGTRTATINLPAGLDITCTFVNQFNSETTRTQGFWQTHMGLLEAVWFGGTSGGHTFADPGAAARTLCGREITNVEDLLGGFWANISQTSTKTKRSALDQARMRLLQQLLAAMSNNFAFGSNPTGDISIQEAKDAFCGTDIEDINDAAAAMAAFNEGGDSEEFTPGGSANGKQAKDAANVAFWDKLPAGI